MKDKTILEGCEVLCLGFEGSDYVACPLPFGEQKACKQRLQYQAGYDEARDDWNRALDIAIAESYKAGMKKVVEFCKENQMPDKPSSEPYPGLVIISKERWQTQLEKWGV